MQELMTLKEAKRQNPAGPKDKKKSQTEVAILNKLLANEFSLFAKTLNFHWNITGGRFLTLHKFLEDQYRSLLEIMDLVAERIRILGDRPLSSLPEMNSVSDIKESPARAPSADLMLNELLRDHLLVQKDIKQALKNEKLFQNDLSTQDMLIDLLKQHEKMSWMLKSHVVDESMN